MLRKGRPCLPASLTRVDPDAQAQLLTGTVPDAKGLHSFQECEGHADDLVGVELAISNRQAGHHHVGITNGLHLWPGPRSRVSWGRPSLQHCFELGVSQEVTPSHPSKAHLVDIKVVYDCIEASVEVIEECHHLVIEIGRDG